MDSVCFWDSVRLRSLGSVSSEFSSVSVMRLADLIHLVSPDEVWAAILKWYPEEPAHHRESYAVHQDHLKDIVPVSSKFLLHVYIEHEDDELWPQITLRVPGDTTPYAGDFEPWADWLGMEIVPESKLCAAEIVAFCFWEMTYHGFGEEEIVVRRDEVLATVEEITRLHEARD